ncbi:MAG TPA: DinB family protein [Candidatus Udaeobacter sp.]|nr:DinB family protein [Candidatus Udaeobacter sp.]
MNESQRLAKQFDRALEGGAWYGPSWREVLDGVTRAQALHRPIPEAHSIAEVVLHAATWQDVVRQRLAGGSPQVPDDQDWQVVKLPDDAAWTAVVNRLFETGKALRDQVESFAPERLQELRSGVDDSWYGLIVGEMQHVLYHAGQIGLLKKSLPKTG